MFPALKRNNLSTLQVNLGYKCNQACSHCHVDAGPNRTEMMDDETIRLIPRIIEKYKISCLDITGGAPEIHNGFKNLILESNKLGIDIIDRCNLTILTEDGYEDLAQFLADQNVIVTASLPCYEKNNVDKQRGIGVFERSITALKELNKLGYGKNGSNLILNLVYNPIGPCLPPPQKSLELAYKRELLEKFNVYFNNLYTITNMPIKRFAKDLIAKGEYQNYNRLLLESFNSENIDNLMCKYIISVNWKGEIFDCDFNQQLGISINSKLKTLNEILNHDVEWPGKSITVGQHCYGCTAGSGSSCSGSLN